MINSNSGMSNGHDASPPPIKINSNSGMSNGHDASPPPIKRMRRTTSVTLPPPIKFVRDCIHGTIQLKPLIVKIIDTPQFQRQRNLLQMGATSFIYPTADHRRFEHALGTYHLASVLLKTIVAQQGDIPWCKSETREKDILCVEIAALCHDVGHGPFSHFWDGIFIPRMIPDKNQRVKHERWSELIIDEIYEEQKKHFEEHGLGDEDHLFIKSLIHGWDSDSEAYRTIQEKKGKEGRFLYEIVSNKEAEVDVDKWDYLTRDCHYLKISSFDIDRFLVSVRVVDDKDEVYHFALMEREVYTVNNMFQNRHHLHRIACHHRVTVVIEEMLFDGFRFADKKLGLSRKCIKDSSVKQYLTLTDAIFWNILASDDEELKDAKDVFQRILRRDLYHFVSAVAVEESNNTAFQLEREVILEELGDKDAKSYAVAISQFHFGMKDKNPLCHMHFFRRVDNGDGFEVFNFSKENLPKMLPNEPYQEREIRFFCKNHKPVQCGCYNKVEEFCNDNGLNPKFPKWKP